jgi:predicted RNA-binding Zn-ribbon protein involved in translation (DUF1610 family)
MLKSETQSCKDAIRILLTAAQDQLEVLAEEDVKRQYGELIHAWDSETLFEGSISELETVLGTNLDRISREAGFRKFIVECHDDEGYAGIMAVFPQSVVPIRMWRAADRFYLCGNRHFKGLTSSAGDLSKRGGRRLFNLLRAVLLVALASGLWFIWATDGLRTWVKIICSVVSVVLCMIAWLLAWSETSGMRDCPSCGRILRLKMDRRFTGNAFSSKNIQHVWTCRKCGFTKDFTYGKDFG